MKNLTDAQAFEIGKFMVDRVRLARIHLLDAAHYAGLDRSRETIAQIAAAVEQLEQILNRIAGQSLTGGPK